MKIDNIYKKVSEINRLYGDELYNYDLLEYLEEFYPEIKSAMDEEDYNVEYPIYTFFSEVIYEDKVVGFYTIEKRILDHREVINEFYILPKYRGKNIFGETMMLLCTLPDTQYVLRNPTRIIMESLLKNELAIKISENLVYSYIKVAEDIDNYYSNNNIKELYKSEENDNRNYFGYSDLYNLKYSSIISFDSKETISKNKVTVLISTPREQEIEKYNLQETLNEISLNDISNIEKNVLEDTKTDKFTEGLILDYINLLTVENIFGSEDNLHEDIQELIDEKGFEKEEVINAIKKVDKAFEAGEVTPLSLITRFNYLLDNPDKKALADDEEDFEECPYCDSIIHTKNSTCPLCGYNLMDFLPPDFEDIFDEEFDYEDEFDEESGLEINYYDEVLDKGYDPKLVYEEQLEIATNSFLKLIDENPSYPARLPFEDDFHISEDDVIDYIKSNKFVEEKVNPRYDEDFYELIMNPENMPDYNIMDEYIFKITKKGRRHYKKNKISQRFISYFDEMDYYEFKEYCKKHSDKKIDEIAQDYINLNIREAVENKDMDLYLKMCESEQFFYKDKDKYIPSIFKSVICELNRNYLNNEEIEYIDEANMVILALLDDLDDELDFEMVYEKTYDNIEYEELKIRKEENKEIIKKLMKRDVSQYFDSDGNVNFY